LPLPGLVIRGERTRLYYGLIAESALGTLPNVEGARLPGAGHMTIVENPADTATLLSRMFERA
jgi:pimeloyl-ACP methyl ester carboxylesterase